MSIWCNPAEEIVPDDLRWTGKEPELDALHATEIPSQSDVELGAKYWEDKGAAFDPLTSEDDE